MFGLACAVHRMLLDRMARDPGVQAACSVMGEKITKP